MHGKAYTWQQSAATPASSASFTWLLSVLDSVPVRSTLLCPMQHVDALQQLLPAAHQPAALCLPCCSTQATVMTA